MYSKINEQLDESISRLTHILELISDIQDADPIEYRYLSNVKREIGSFIEWIISLQKSFDDYCFDPELGDQGAIIREIIKSDSEKLREAIKSSTSALCGLPFSGHIGE